MSTPITVHGIPLTPRMKDMGIIGMVQTSDGWKATFVSFPGAAYLLPPPVSDWLFTVQGE